MLLNYISIPAFIISFAIGLFFVYVLGPNMKKVLIFPSPENVDKVLFKDNADNCFYFKPVEVSCPSDESKITNIPIQAS
jgi:hypothetical protein